MLHDLGGPGDGAPPVGLIFDKVGNIYGVPYSGNLYSNGTIFELTKSANGTWTKDVLYSFQFRKAGA